MEELKPCHFQQGDIIRFAWNPIFHEPSCLEEFTVERIVKQDDEGLYVDMLGRKLGHYKLRLSALQEAFDYYKGEVEPIFVVNENVQLDLSM